MRKIEMIFPLRGISTGKSSIQTEAFGYVGGACKTLTDTLLKALGGTQENEQLKPEYYQQDQAIEHITDGSS